MQVNHPIARLIFAPIWIASTMILLQGCISKPPPLAVHYPITSGSHEALPSSREGILVWGEEPLTQLAVEWLIAHHYAAIIRPEAEFSQDKEQSHTFSDRKRALSVAQKMEADFVLFLDREESKDGALVEPRCDDQFYVDVTVRGVSVPTDAVVWRGNAHYPHCVDLSRGTFQSLTCQGYCQVVDNVTQGLFSADESRCHRAGYVFLGNMRGAGCLLPRVTRLTTSHAIVGSSRVTMANSKQVADVRVSR
jgi:hypothetical protein